MTSKPCTLTLEQRRAEAVKLHLSGLPVMQVVAQTGMCRSAVDRAIKLYAAGGPEALVPRPRGRKPGTGQKLSDEQQRRVRDLMRLRRPWFYGLGSTLWTRELVMSLIERKLGVTMTDRALGNYLVAWGIVLGSRHEEPRNRCSPSVRRWLDLNYSTVIGHARAVDAKVFWINKAKPLPWELWTPELREAGVGGAAESVEMVDAADEYDAEADPKEFRAVGGGSLHASRPAPPKTYRLASAINNQGKLHWAVINSPFNKAQRLRFEKALVNNAGKQHVVIINQDGGTQADAEIEVWRPDADATVWTVP